MSSLRRRLLLPTVLLASLLTPLRPTPFGRLSGLEILATATANSLQGDGLAPWPTGRCG